MSAILVLALAAASPPCCPEAKPEGKRAARCARVAMEQRCGSVLKTNVSATLRTFCPVACGSCRVCRSAASENASVVLYSRLATAILGSKAHRPFESFSPPAGMSASDFGAVQSGLTRSQLDLVAKVAEHVVERDGWLLEVGSFYGNSASAFARAARQQGSRMPIVCLDTWLGERKMWAKKGPWLQLDKHGTPRLWEQFMTNIIHWQLTDQIIPFRLTSGEGVPFLLSLVRTGVIPPPAAIYLDTAHTYPETLLELESAWPLLASGGILVGDDFDLWWPPVQQSVLEFASRVGPSELAAPAWTREWPEFRHMLRTVRLSPCMTPRVFRRLTPRVRLRVHGPLRLPQRVRFWPVAHVLACTRNARAHCEEAPCV